jgi:hypothetical protein
MSRRKRICEFLSLLLIIISNFNLGVSSDQFVYLEPILPHTGIWASLELCSHAVGTCGVICLVIPKAQDLPWDQHTYGHERVES